MRRRKRRATGHSWGQSIREARRAVNLTQEELGRRIGIQGRGIHRWERNIASPTPHHRAALLQALQAIDTRAAAILKAAFSASPRTTGAAPMATQGPSSALAALPAAELPAAGLGGPTPSHASRDGLSRDGVLLTAIGAPSVAQTEVPNPALGGAMPPTTERDGTSPAAVAIELAVLRLADELDLPARRVRRPLVRLLRQLRRANLTLEGAERELEGWIGDARS